MHSPASDPERRRFLARLLREVSRSEQQAHDHATREVRRLGETAPPAAALRAISAHAAELQPRFTTILAGHHLTPARGGLGYALASLRDLVVDGVVDAERAYRIAVLDLRHGVDVVKLLREVAHKEQLFGVIRWCDDWLSARRMLVAHAERALAWFSTPAAASRLDDHRHPDDRPWWRDRG